MQTPGSGQALVLDARIPAVIVATGLFAIKTPFVVAVLVAALVAAGLRAVS